MKEAAPGLMRDGFKHNDGGLSMSQRTGSATGYIVIPHWRDFQHYKGRRPVWIKNYVSLLDNPEYLALSSYHRGLLHGLWLLYAKRAGELPASPSYISQQLGNGTEWQLRQQREDGESVARAWREDGERAVRMRDLKRLEKAGFVVIVASLDLDLEKDISWPLDLQYESKGQVFNHENKSNGKNVP